MSLLPWVVFQLGLIVTFSGLSYSLVMPDLLFCTLSLSHGIVVVCSRKEGKTLTMKASSIPEARLNKSGLRNLGGLSNFITSTVKNFFYR